MNEVSNGVHKVGARAIVAQTIPVAKPRRFGHHIEQFTIVDV